MNAFVKLTFILLAAAGSYAHAATPEIFAFKNGELTLHGILYRPQGSGPFPAVLYNHGSAPGMLNNKVSDRLGPLFAQQGWVFFMPYRRGQGLSADAGPYILDEVESTFQNDGLEAAAAKLTELLKGVHLSDQLAGLAWLEKQDFVQSRSIASFGNSFGGIQALLGASYGTYCAAIDAAGGAMSWDSAPPLREMMVDAAQVSRAPIFFFQAENDFTLTPSKALAAAMHDAQKPYLLKIYPPFGKSKEDGHAFAYWGDAVWGKDVFSFLKENCLTGK